MVRKSDRNKAGSSAAEKTPAKKATRSTRRRKKSTSESEPEPEPEIQPTAQENEAEHVLFEAQPAETPEVGQSTRGRTRRSARNRTVVQAVENVELPAVVEEPKKDDDWNADEVKTSTSKEETPASASKEGEASTWKIQSSNGAGGEIQKLKICRQRLTDSAESSSSPAKDAAAASPRRKRYRKRRKHDSERAESAESHTDSESTTASAVANIPASYDEEEVQATVDTEMTVEAAVEQAEIAEAVESIKGLEAAVIEEHEVVMEEEAAPVVSQMEVQFEYEAKETVSPETVVEKVEEIQAEGNEVVSQQPKVEEQVKVKEEVTPEPIKTETEEPPVVSPKKETPVETEVVEEGEIVTKRRKRGQSDDSKKSAKATKFSTEVAMEQIAKKLNERAALRTTSKDVEEKEKKEVAGGEADTPASGVSEEGEISPKTTPPAPAKPTITVVKPNKPQEQSSKPPVLKRATAEGTPVQRRRRTSAKSKPKDEQIGISSTNLKLLVPEVEPVALDEVKEALLSTKKATTIEERPAEEEDATTPEEEETRADDEEKATATPAVPTTATSTAAGIGEDGQGEEATSTSANDDVTSATNVSGAAKRQKRLSGSKERDEDEVGAKSRRKMLKEVKDDNVTPAREVKKKTPIVITHDDSKENKPERKSDENHKMVRKITLVSDDGKALRRSLSPVGKKQTPTPVLFITNLVRPFTVPQLRELLARTGTIATNGFYIDKIKSKCYVKYEDVEMAIETRHALHGVRWPVNNPKTLRVEFSSDEAMGVVQKAAEDELNNSGPVVVKYETIGDRDGVTSGGWLSEKAALKPARRVTTAVREWDVGKSASGDIQQSVPPTAAAPGDGRKSKATDDDWSVKDRSKDRGAKGDADGRRRAASPDLTEPVRKIKKRDTEAPAKLLDDLFKKTTATPCIYWLPLTAEQIAVKEELRRQQFAEHERRLAELRKDVSSSRRDRDRSRDRDRERDRDRDRDRRKK